MIFYGQLLQMALQEEEPFLVWVLDPLYFNQAMCIMEDIKNYGEEDLVDTLLASNRVAFYDKLNDAYYVYGKHINHPHKSQLVQHVKLLAQDGTGFIFFIDNRDN